MIITMARPRWALIGENSANDTAATVVAIANSNISLTSLIGLFEDLYQNAPSTATPIMIGIAIPSITENW